MKSLELKWGLIIGVANLVWWIGTYYLGMHTKGLGLQQLLIVIGGVISLFGYVIAFRELVQRRPETTFREGLQFGIMVAGIVSIWVIFMRWIYHVAVFPGYTDFVVEEYRKYYEAKELTAEELQLYLDGARKSFSTSLCVGMAGVGSFLSGSIFSVIIMAFIRRMARR